MNLKEQILKNTNVLNEMALKDIDAKIEKLKSEDKPIEALYYYILNIKKSYILNIKKRAEGMNKSPGSLLSSGRQMAHKIKLEFENKEIYRKAVEIKADSPEEFKSKLEEELINDIHINTQKIEKLSPYFPKIKKIFEDIRKKDINSYKDFFQLNDIEKKIYFFSKKDIFSEDIQNMADGNFKLVKESLKLLNTPLDLPGLKMYFIISKLKDELEEYINKNKSNKEKMKNILKFLKDVKIGPSISDSYFSEIINKLEIALEKSIKEKLEDGDKSAKKIYNEILKASREIDDDKKIEALISDKLTPKTLFKLKDFLTKNQIKSLAKKMAMSDEELKRRLGTIRQSNKAKNMLNKKINIKEDILRNSGLLTEDEDEDEDETWSQGSSTDYVPLIRIYRHLKKKYKKDEEILKDELMKNIKDQNLLEPKKFKKYINDIFGNKIKMKFGDFAKKLKDFEPETGKEYNITRPEGYEGTQVIDKVKNIGINIEKEVAKILKNNLDKIKTSEYDRLKKLLNRGHFESTQSFLRYNKVSDDWVHVSAIQTDFFNKLKMELNMKDLPRKIGQEILALEKDSYRAMFSKLVNENQKAKVFTMSDSALAANLENISNKDKLNFNYEQIPLLFGMSKKDFSYVKKVITRKPRPKEEEIKVNSFLRLMSKKMRGDKIWFATRGMANESVEE